ncbi:hypothetical protein SASPL_108508 [Salvia splendens]|uniref:CUE domain-containing protein n=1 Tax=Salvia splendens TaxID=180675 RepID=A0A8X8YIE1_SALSN|nr:hypothetical protein SASPL_108508 [Salvia splendens]
MEASFCKIKREQKADFDALKKAILDLSISSQGRSMETTDASSGNCKSQLELPKFVDDRDFHKSIDVDRAIADEDLMEQHSSESYEEMDIDLKIGVEDCIRVSTEIEDIEFLRSDTQHDEVIGGKMGKQFDIEVESAAMWQPRPIVHFELRFGVDARAVERSYFEDIDAGASSPAAASLPAYKKLRCSSSTSPVRFTYSPPVHTSSVDQLKDLFPELEIQLLEKALEESVNDLDLAIKKLHEFCRGHVNEKIDTTEENATMEKVASQTSGDSVPLQEPQTQNNLPADGAEWVDLFVREMMSATSIDDARFRAASILESLEKSISPRACAEAAQNSYKENLMLKEHIEVLLRDNAILKRDVCLIAAMAFSPSLNLKCHPWTSSHNLIYRFASYPSSPSNIITLQFSRNSAKRPSAKLLPAVPSGIPNVLLSPDFTPKQLLDCLRGEKDEKLALRLFQLASEQPNFVPALPVYEEILEKLGNVGSFDSIRKVLNHMKLSNIDVVEPVFFISIGSYAKFELYDEAISVLGVMEKEFRVRPGTHAYNFLMNVLVDGNKLKLVESVHLKMINSGVKPDISTFNILIKALCKAHQIRPAILLMEEMPMYGLAPDEKTFTTIMQGYIEEGNLEGALRVREQMVAAQCQWSNVTINELINGFCKEGRIEEALIFVQKMVNEGFCPDKFTFNTLISGLCKAGHVSHALRDLGFDAARGGEVKEAMEVLNQMLSRDCSPNAVTYNAIISTLCKGNQVEEATELARSLTSKGILPDVSTFNSLIQGLCLTSNFNIAMELFSEMKMEGCEPDEFTYNILIDCLCGKGKLEEALRLLKDMESSGCARSVITYNTLIDGFCKSRKIEEAEEIFDQMELQGVSRNLVTYNTLIDGLCKAKRVDEAAQLMDQVIMEGLKPDKFTYNSLLSHFCREGDIQKAADIVQTMTSNGCEPDVVTYGTLIQGLCKAGRVEVATRLLRSLQMKGMVLTPHAYNPVVQALFRRRKVKEAMQLFREMEEKNDPPDAISYKIVFRGLCSGGGHIGEAVDFALEVAEKGYLPDVSSFNMLAEGLCSLNMEETLVKLVDKIMVKARFSQNEAAMIRGFLKIRKFSDALAGFGRVLESRKPRKSYWR